MDCRVPVRGCPSRARAGPRQLRGASRPWQGYSSLPARCARRLGRRDQITRVSAVSLRSNTRRSQACRLQVRDGRRLAPERCAQDGRRGSPRQQPLPGSCSCVRPLQPTRARSLSWSASRMPAARPWARFYRRSAVAAEGSRKRAPVPSCGADSGCSLPLRHLTPK